MTSSLRPNHPDHNTVAALRAGDHAVFTRLVTELTPGLTRLARTYLPAALADEVVQDAWMSVVKSLATFEGRSSLKTWIYRILLNRVRTVAVREAKIVPFTALGPHSAEHRPAVDSDRLTHPELGQGYWPEAPQSWSALPADQLEASETRALITEAIATLPGAQREVVTLRDVEGLTAEEVCNVLGISSVNQRVLLHRGRTALRAILEDTLP